MIETIINDIGQTNIAIIAAAVLLAIAVLICALRKRGQKRRATQAAQAAEVFKNEVLEELKGLYPIRQLLDPKILGKFRSSIPQIEAAAAKLRPFIPSESRKSFDDTLKKYCVHCKKITLADCIATNLSPGKGKTEALEAKEIFRQNVNELLSFSK